MKESLSQATELSQQLSLSPLQVQFARALEMTGPEFEDDVRRAVDENPALEADTDDALLPLDDNGRPSGEFAESADQIQRADYRNDDDAPAWSRASADDDAPGAETFAEAAGETLLESLMSQIAELQLSDREKALAEYVAGDIDDNGYLTRTPRQIANDLTFNVGVETSADEIERIADLIRGFEPPGVGAVDLRQALMLQLERLDPSSEAVADAMTIARDHFDLFTRKHFDRIAPASGIAPERVGAALDLLRSLNPKPGASFGRDRAQERLRHITPDFEVEPDPSGRLTLSMGNSIPRLRVEASFAADDIVVGRKRDADAALAFIRRKRDEALDYIRAARMRQETLWNVMTAILKLQKEFMTSGNPTDLKPMILKDVAALTGYDLSVVSRATAGKYVATPHGVYPLKYFFNERPKEELDASSHEILEALRKVIEAEDKRSPLSDQAIAERLQADGYDIARRTVTKYRERLGLPVARLRREL